jgi:hypothetical protein
MRRFLVQQLSAGRSLHLRILVAGIERMRPIAGGG